MFEMCTCKFVTYIAYIYIYIIWPYSMMITIYMNMSNFIAQISIKIRKFRVNRISKNSLMNEVPGRYESFCFSMRSIEQSVDASARFLST